SKIPLAAVLDGDQQPDEDHSTFTLPGSKGPEEEILNCPTVDEYLGKTYRISKTEVRSLIEGVHHQGYFSAVGDYLAVRGDYLQGDLARVNAKGLAFGGGVLLVQQLKRVAGCHDVPEAPH